MATHSSILAWRISMDWEATALRVAKSRTQLSKWAQHNIFFDDLSLKIGLAFLLLSFKCSSYILCNSLLLDGRQWHPTPVLFPGKSHGRRSRRLQWAAVHWVAKSRIRLNDFPFTFHFHTLEKEMATHSSVLAWRIPGTGEPGGLPSMGSHRVGHD